MNQGQEIECEHVGMGLVEDEMVSEWLLLRAAGGALWTFGGSRRRFGHQESLLPATR